MKKVLVVTPACHFSNPGGVQEDVYATIRLLQTLGHDVALYTVDSPQQSQEILEHVRKTTAIDVRTFRPDLTRMGEWIAACLREPALFDRGAYPLKLLSENAAFREYAAGFDVVLAFCSYAWPVLKAGTEMGKKTILRSHNFESEFFWEALSIQERGNPANWLRRFAKYRGERLAVRYADVTGSLRFREMALYEKWKPGTIKDFTLAYLPPLVHGPRIQKTDGPLDIFYLGASYNVTFNRRGAEVMLRDIAPPVHLAAPGAFRFHICGGKLPEDLRALCDGKGTIYEGYVEHLEPFLEKMDAGVFPIFTKVRSVRGKIFGSICRAFPTILTRIGAGEYPFVDGRHVLYAETPEEFVTRILELRDAQLRKRLSEGAAEYSEREFSQTALLGQLRSMFRVIFPDRVA